MDGKDQLPTGWYTDEDGQRRFWDGQAWLVPDNESDMNEPAVSPPLVGEPGVSETRSKPKKKRRTKTIVIASVIVIVLAAGSVLTVKAVQNHQATEAAKVVATQNAATAKKVREEKVAEAEAEEERKATAAAKKTREDERKAEKLAAELAEKQADDDHMTSGAAGSVWEVIESGDFYFSYGADDQFDCGRWDCVMVQVVSLTGCPGGAYVEASIENAGGAVVGWTNVRIGAIEPDQVGADLLEDTSGLGSSFNVSEVKCYKS